MYILLSGFRSHPSFPVFSPSLATIPMAIRSSMKPTFLATWSPQVFIPHVALLNELSFRIDAFRMVSVVTAMMSFGTVVPTKRGKVRRALNYVLQDSADPAET